MFSSADPSLAKAILPKPEDKMATELHGEGTKLVVAQKTINALPNGCTIKVELPMKIEPSVLMECDVKCADVIGKTADDK